MGFDVERRRLGRVVYDLANSQQPRQRRLESRADNGSVIDNHAQNTTDNKIRDGSDLADVGHVHISS